MFSAERSLSNIVKGDGRNAVRRSLAVLLEMHVTDLLGRPRRPAFAFLCALSKAHVPLPIRQRLVPFPSFEFRVPPLVRCHLNSGTLRVSWRQRMVTRQDRIRIIDELRTKLTKGSTSRDEAVVPSSFGCRY